jgi:hypothetical protein
MSAYVNRKPINGGNASCTTTMNVRSVRISPPGGRHASRCGIADSSAVTSAAVVSTGTYVLMIRENPAD